ncbi:MAG TPA: aspartate kinase [Elusimicrobia bacterium]|nr:aspartate kinase [Elusimicrobiota bacterium]
MKFGGTSVADPEKILRAAERAVRARKEGSDVVVVVSAPGEMTDELIALAQRVSQEPDAREMDVLLATGEQMSIALFAMACRSLGCPAVSLTGPQAGIHADDRHTRSRILEIRPQKIFSELRAGRICVVAGFQAVNPNSDVTTLGRGGSDLSAVALAAVLRASGCEIFTDVKGVYTADPRIVPDARKIASLSYEEMLELAGAGAQVMQARSIDLAHRYGVRIHVRSAFHPVAGTWIEKAEEKRMEDATVSSLALDKGEVRLTLVEVPDKPGIAARVLTELAKKEIAVDMIVQSAPTQAGVNDISLMTPRATSEAARATLEALARRIGAKRVDITEQVAKVTVVGTGFRRHAGIAAKMFGTLADAGINIHMITTSDLKLCCIVDARHAESALRALHKAFKLGRR